MDDIGDSQLTALEGVDTIRPEDRAIVPGWSGLPLEGLAQPPDCLKPTANRGHQRFRQRRSVRPSKIKISGEAPSLAPASPVASVWSAASLSR